MAAALVSVIIPAYNCSELIKEAIASVHGQTWPELEIVVVDDGSSEDIRAAVNPDGERVRYVHQNNAGPAVARNTGAGEARGQYLAFLDADDLWLPEKLRKQVAALEADPEAGMAFSDGYIITRGEPVTPESPRLLRMIARASSHNQFHALFRNNFVPTSSVLVSRERFFEVGGFDPGLRFNEDFDFSLRMAYRRRLIYLDEPLMVYRRHPGNTSSEINRQNAYERLAVQARIRSYVLSKLPEKIDDPMIRVFRALPFALQFVIIFWWRFWYAPSKGHALRRIVIYLRALLGQGQGGGSI